MKNTIHILALFTLHSALCTLHAAVPLRWTVETSRAQVAQFEAYRGETLALEASLNSYGTPLNPLNNLNPQLYWQTNGMGSAWWTAPATASGNVVRAIWSPTNDCGAASYSCFIGSPESTYRAAFRLRMLPSPGFTPNVLRPPSTTLDESDPLFSAWLATNEFNTAGVDTNAVLGLIAAATNAITPQSIGAQERFGENPPGFLDAGVRYAYAAGIAYSDGRYRPIEDTYAEKYEVEVLHAQVNSLGDHYNEISGTVSAWQTYWDGDDVRVTVTNYYGTMGLPALYIENKMAADDEHENTWFKIIWDERTRWSEFLQGYTSLTNHVHQDLADRAWGLYDSSSGAYSPDGLLQLSQEQILIAPGMSYQKTVTAGGCAVWVLRSTGPTMMTGETETGYFRIQDGDGNSLFEIVKGDKRVVGATATGISIDGGVMTISYNSVSDEHPTLEICTDLKLSDWETETATTAATVSWSGSSGAWIATVTPVGARASLFAKATFEAGGNTYIRNNVATSIDKVVIGGREYTVTVETVNGKQLMVLK